MSWPGEDWTVGLNGHVLQKVKQLQAQNEKLSKEKQQRQLQLDNSDVALHKQKQKYEEVRVELAAVHRELGEVREATQAEVRARERLARDLQVKTGQVHSLEGQLESSKNLTQSLTQEIKWLEAELEKLQKGNGSGDSVLFSTPCWNMSSPRDHNGGFRVDGDSKAQPIRQQLQFGDIPKPRVGGSSSQFPQQPQKSPPLRHHIRQSEPSTPSSMFPWECDDVWSIPKGRSASSVSSSDVIVKNNDSGIEEALRSEIDALRVRVSDLQREAQLESEHLKDVESRLTQANRDLSTKEQSLTRTQDHLTRAQSRITQETDRAQTAEQRVKQLQEELKCQRQNAETSRCNAEQRRKEIEREHQRKLLEQQRERQALEKQHQQESNRLNQEIQQAGTLHNTLLAQHDKVCLQKQGLDKDLEDVKGKLKNTDTDLRESQKREIQTEAKLTDALRENANLTVSLGQMKKQEKILQEEVKRLTDELAEALRHIKELQAQLAVPRSSSISLQCDRSPPYHPHTHTKKASQTGPTREEERMTYPSGREPGEGIDFEHIRNFGSEGSQKFKAKGVTRQSGSLKLRKTEADTSLMEQDTSVEDVNADSLMSGSDGGAMSKSELDVTCTLQGISCDTSGNVGKCDSVSLKDLKKENSEIRDELRDVKYELQKRLEDLEYQRRAEAEARTKLKQLSRKHSTQTEQQRAKALELKDSVTKLEAQLEQEKRESTKLRATLDVLEKEAEKRQEQKERDQKQSTNLKEVLTEMEQRETYMVEEMKRMKEQLEDLQMKLEQEQKEREQERIEKQVQKEEAEGLKIAQLQKELDCLRRFASLEEKISKDNVPVTYLQLECHSNTKNTVLVENEDFILSPDVQESICDSVNYQNDIVCKEIRATELIMDPGAQTQPTGTTTEGMTSAAEKEGTRAKCSEAADFENTAILVLEIERLRLAKDQEFERAKVAQRKFEDLQKQVTTQTKHLTLAFESQSKHIEDLLKELHDKECALQRQGEEMQKCQEVITVLEEAKHTREDFSEVFSEAFTHLGLSTEISRDLSCDSVISSTSISDHEMFNDDMLQILKDSKSSIQLPVEHSVSQTVFNTRDVSDKLQIITVTCQPHELSLTSDTNCEYGSSSKVNSEGRELSKLTDKKAEETENSASRSSHLQDQSDHSKVLNLQHNVPEHSTDDSSELQRVQKELQEAQIQLDVLKQNEALGLQVGKNKEEQLSVKLRNEELTSKLSLIDKYPCANSTTKQNTALPIMYTKNNDFIKEGPDVATSGPEKSFVVPLKHSGDEMEEIKGKEESMGCENEYFSTTEVQSLQGQIQALQDQIQDLSEQNRAQAEELELWKLSAVGETVGSGSPSIMLQQFEIFLPCTSTKLPVQQKRSMMHQCTTDMSYRCRVEDGNDQTNLPETQMTRAVSESQGPAEDLMTRNETLIILDNAEECDGSSVNHSKSHIMTSNTNDEPAQQFALVPPEYQSNMSAPRAIRQEDALINLSILSQYQTKVINTKPVTGPCKNNHSKNSALSAVETVALDKHRCCHGDTTDKQNCHATAMGSVLCKNESNFAQSHRAEISEVTGDLNRMEIKDVHSVSTQTEESRELGLDISSDHPLQHSLVHTSTQTDGVMLETEEDEGDKEPADSPPLSPTPHSVTNQLLLSKAFPMSDPAHLAERIRQNRNRMSAAYDDTEYEPYGLPEVVMKGFADIPSGPACPYVLRRGLLGTDAMPLPLREATLPEKKVKT